MYLSWELGYMKTPKREIRLFVVNDSFLGTAVIFLTGFCCTIEIVGMTAASIYADFLRLDFSGFEGSYFLKGFWLVSVT